MRSLGGHVNEDANQFGPGTDLIIAILGLLMLLTFGSMHFYDAERERGNSYFRLATEWFSTTDFPVYPVTHLPDSLDTDRRVRAIVGEFRATSADFPFIFVVGHSSAVDDPAAADRSRSARLRRNWSYAGRRAALIASMIEQYLTDEERQRLILLSAGEFDLARPAQPDSQENARVEVVFGREWKPLARVMR